MYGSFHWTRPRFSGDRLRLAFETLRADGGEPMYGEHRAEVLRQPPSPADMSPHTGRGCEPRQRPQRDDEPRR